MQPCWNTFLFLMVLMLNSDLRRFQFDVVVKRCENSAADSGSHSTVLQILWQSAGCHGDLDSASLPSQISSWPKKWWWRSQVPSWSGGSLSDSITHSWTRPPTTCTGTKLNVCSTKCCFMWAVRLIEFHLFLSGFMERTRLTCTEAWTAAASQWRLFMDNL